MPESPQTAARQVAFAALRHADFRAYFLCSAAAMMADNVEHVISYWVMFQKFHSPALADRYDCRRIIQVALVLFMGVSLAWGLLFLTDTIELWHAVLLLTVHGMAGVIWGPASQLLIHDIVGPEQLQSAVRLSATSRYLGLLMGPAVGGGLMLALGPPWGLLANVLIYAPLLVWLWIVPYDGHRRHARGTGRRGGGLGDTLALLRQVSGNQTIFPMILLAGVSSLFVGNAFQAQMPEYAHDLGTDDAGARYSILLGANAAGALVGGLLLESRGLLPARPRTAIAFALVWCLVIAGFAAATSYPLAVALMFVAGFLNLAYSSMSQTLVQLHAPAQLRGRLIGLYNTANNGMRAFSGITVGIVGSLIGIHWSLALSAMALLAVTLGLWAFAMRSARED